MNENYIMLNGKRVDLTEEQIEKLGLKVKKKDCFTREKGDMYYYISNTAQIGTDVDDGSFPDSVRHSVANYCTNKELMQQRALHETLSRLLWRFSMQNDGDKIDWNPVSDHCFDKYCIVYNHYNKRFDIYSCETSQLQGIIHFHKEEIAKRAINEIVLPFMKEHPDFVW